MYNSFCRIINGTSIEKAWEKINDFEEYVPLNKKPIKTYQEFSNAVKDEALSLAQKDIDDEMSNYGCLPLAICIDLGAKKEQKKHWYLFFGYYHS